MNDNAKKVFEGKKVLVLEHDGWEFVERIKGKSAVAILAVTDDDRILFVEQFRPPVNARGIDFPAGLVGDKDGNDDPAETAIEAASASLAASTAATVSTISMRS